MGIKNLNKLIDKYANGAIYTIPITKFKGLRIAIDASVWMYSNLSIAKKRVIEKTNVVYEEIDFIEVRKQWLKFALAYIGKIVKYGVTPVFVFDGTPLKDKEMTKKKRLDNKDKLEDKLFHLRKIVCKFLHNRNQLDHSDGSSDETDKPPEATKVQILEYRRLLASVGSVPGEDVLIFRLMLQQLGIPVLQAINDAEQLCSSLCAEGKVAAVLSTDTDCLPFGSPLLIGKFDEEISIKNKDGSYERVPACKGVVLQEVLDELELDFKNFVDLCICMGCDFNTNMKGIGMENAYKLIMEHRRIEKFPPKYDVACLRYRRCREIFRPKPVKDVVIFDTDYLFFVDKNDDDMLTGAFYNQLHYYLNAIKPIIEFENKQIIDGESFLSKLDIDEALHQFMGFYEGLIKCYDGWPKFIKTIPNVSLGKKEVTLLRKEYSNRKKKTIVIFDENDPEKDSENDSENDSDKDFTDFFEEFDNKLVLDDALHYFHYQTNKEIKKEISYRVRTKIYKKNRVIIPKPIINRRKYIL